MKLKLTTLALLLQLAGACMAAPASPTSTGLDTKGFDTTVRAQDDLFRAANGGWLNRTKIPADKADYGAFTMLADQSDAQVRAIVDELARSQPPLGSIEQKVGAFYKSYLDTAGIDKAGLQALKQRLADIAAISSRAELAKWLGRAQGQLGTPIQLDVTADFKHPEINRVMSWQGGLGLPDRDYYLKQDDKRLQKAYQAYAQYLNKLATLAGDKQAVESARRALALEQKIAAAHWGKVETRDPEKIYNPMNLAQLNAAAPGFDWAAFLAAASLPQDDTLIIGQPSTVTAVAKLAAEESLDDWKAYLSLRTIDTLADLLPKAFRDASFAFHGKALTGAQADQPRWQKAIAELNGAMGEAVGQLYVAKHFPPAHKQRMQELVKNLLAAYRESIEALSWMTPATKAQAQDKLSKYMTKIGYPDNWRDYSKLEVQAGDALGNSLRAAQFNWARTAAKAGKPVDRAEWGMTPQTVNAYYNPSLNEIVFPAAILQAPFFDMAADDAVNYGAIGAVIGHEISHGFDDEGSKFDGDGALRNWWTEDDRKAFESVTARLIEQYNGYQPIAGKHLNGKLTLGENIADLSGLQIAFKAYQASLKGAPAPVIDGLNGEQRFFLGWAQAWREKTREERSLQLLTIDPHSPPKFRANGAAVNHDGFHKAFGTKPGDKMFKPEAERIRIW
ncbi:M13 family metallopeptidase [Paucibacter sp. APW11]|uniref:M13 family metallopeptidase n=1 Tax=Roseateles aquae TaxID=3077235 RepID=A0ABU3PAL8_9BURK|nr:M13 family metallopeptidase [Paucibacter sp. APW11]MDT8999618.1 M13 family metallopeptidase [Paucibacter sp. APW11]